MAFKEMKHYEGILTEFKKIRDVYEQEAEEKRQEE
jgi:hypothetical protein